MKSIAVFLFSLFILSSTEVLAAQKVKDCGAAAEDEVERVLDVIHDNLETMMNSVSDLTAQEKRKLRRKVKNVNIKCKDHRAVCKNNPDRGGISRHLFDSAVVICYNRIRSVFDSNAFCGLTNIILHEFAHTAGVKKDRGHNDGINNDRVYRVGNAGESVCRGLGLNRSVSRNTNT